MSARNGSDGEARARLEKQTARLQLAAAAVSAAALCWYMIPEHRRQQMAARARRRCAPAVRRLLAAAHQAAVRRAMERELAGQGEAGYALSERIRARLARWSGLT